MASKVRRITIMTQRHLKLQSVETGSWVMVGGYSGLGQCVETNQTLSYSWIVLGLGRSPWLVGLDLLCSIE